MFSFVWGIPSSVSGFTSTKPLSSSSSLPFSSPVMRMGRASNQRRKKREGKGTGFPTLYCFRAFLDLLFYAVYYDTVQYIFRTTSISWKELLIFNNILRFVFKCGEFVEGKRKRWGVRSFPATTYPQKRWIRKKKKLQEKSLRSIDDRQKKGATIQK